MKTLKELRIALNMSQRELAEKVGVNYRTISSYETGARELPVKIAKKIGEVLEIDWWTLYEEDWREKNMIKFILLAFLLISLFQWFSNNMAVKGLLYYIGTEFGEDELDKIDLKKSSKPL